MLLQFPLPIEFVLADVARELFVVFRFVVLVNFSFVSVQIILLLSTTKDLSEPN